MHVSKHERVNTLKRRVAPMRRLCRSSGGRSGGLRWRTRVSGNSSARVIAKLAPFGRCSALCFSGRRVFSISASEYPCKTTKNDSMHPPSGVAMQLLDGLLSAAAPSACTIWADAGNSSLFQPLKRHSSIPALKKCLHG